MTTDLSNARTHLAWLMWCFNEGYYRAEDRAILENWIALPDEALSLDDVITKENLLMMADEVLIALQAEADPDAQQPGESRAEWKNRTFAMHYGAGPLGSALSELSASAQSRQYPTPSWPVENQRTRDFQDPPGALPPRVGLTGAAKVLTDLEALTARLALLEERVAALEPPHLHHPFLQS